MKIILIFTFLPLLESWKSYDLRKKNFLMVFSMRAQFQIKELWVDVNFPRDKQYFLLTILLSHVYAQQWTWTHCVRASTRHSPYQFCLASNLFCVVLSKRCSIELPFRNSKWTTLLTKPYYFVEVSFLEQRLE